MQCSDLTAGGGGGGVGIKHAAPAPGQECIGEIASPCAEHLESVLQAGVDAEK